MKIRALATDKFLPGLAISVVTLSCSTGGTRNDSAQAQATALPSVTSDSPVPATTGDSTIRSVDFGKIAYPNVPDYSGSRAKRINLKPGETEPTFVQVRRRYR